MYFSKDGFSLFESLRSKATPSQPGKRVQPFVWNWLFFLQWQKFPLNQRYPHCFQVMVTPSIFLLYGFTNWRLYLQMASIILVVQAGSQRITKRSKRTRLFHVNHNGRLCEDSALPWLPLWLAAIARISEKLFQLPISCSS